MAESGVPYRLRVEPWVKPTKDNIETFVLVTQEGEEVRLAVTYEAERREQETIYLPIVHNRGYGTEGEGTAGEQRSGYRMESAIQRFFLIEVKAFERGRQT